MATHNANAKEPGITAGQDDSAGKDSANKADAPESQDNIEVVDEAVIAEEKAELESYRSELEARYAQLDALLRDNEDPGGGGGGKSQQDYPAFTKTDSTLKRNTAFVKKLKNYTEAQRETLLRELPTLNLTKYLEEVANALLEAKLRSSDLPSMLLINCLLHRNYPDYAELALDAWRKQLPTAASAAAAAAASAASSSSSSAVADAGKQQPQQQQQLNLAKLRVDLRLFADLVLTRVVPVMPGLKLLGQCLQYLTVGDAEFSHCGLVCHVLTHAGDAFVGRLPSRKSALADRHAVQLPRATYLDGDARRQFHRLLADYCKRLTGALSAKAAELAQMDRTNRRILNSKGELAQDRRDAFEACKKEVDRLLGLATQLCNLLGEPAPEQPSIGADDLDDEERAAAEAISAPAGAGRLPGLDEATGGGRFEDEDARQFYEMLPDLRPMLPEVLVREARERMEKAAAEAAAAAAAAAEAAKGDAASSSAATETAADDTATSETLTTKEGEDEASEEVLERELEAEEAAAAAAAAIAADAAEATTTAPDTDAAVADDATAAAAATADAADSAATGGVGGEAPSQRQAALEQFLAGLPHLVNRDLIDKAAIQFATGLNSRSSRRRLAQSLLSVHRSRCDLLPFYARLVAVLGPVAPELADELGQRLQRDFKHLFHKRDHTNLETKQKVVRFIGELVKFGLFPPIEAAADLKLLVINFSNHSVEMACALLESCGRYLYATPETHLRLKVYLRNLWNKKTKIVTDERLTAMIENAYYSVVPPDTSRLAKAVQLPPVMLFVQKLLFKDLCNATVEKVLRLCLRLPWDDPEVEQFTVRCFTSVWCVPYGSVHCLASVLAGLAPYHQAAAIAVVDAVLEDVRLGMEINAHRLNQRRVACSRYLGEMYNYCLVESGLVFNTLHSYLSLGSSVAAAAPAAAETDPSGSDGGGSLDPPEHLLRIRLACVLLETCGQYFDSGSNRKRLDAYLLYLQQYYWHKRQHPVWSAAEERPFPLDIEYLYYDTVDTLRPKFKHAASLEEATSLVAKQEKIFLAKLERVAAKLQRSEQAAAAAAAAASYSSSAAVRGSAPLQPIAEDAAAAAAAANAGSTTEASAEDDDDDDEEEEDDEDNDEAGGGGGGSSDEGRGGKRRGGRGRGGGGASQSDGDDHDQEPEAAASPSRRSAPRPELMACPEDDDFVRAFERTLTAETAGVGGGLGVGVGGGVGGGGLLVVAPDDVEIEPRSSSAAAAADGGSSGTVAFTVMTRRGGSSRQQQQLHQPVVQLPADSRLARRYLAAVEADAREREAVKRATLSITETQMLQEEGGAAADDLAEPPPAYGESLLWRSSGQHQQQRRGGGGRKPTSGGGRHF